MAKVLICDPVAQDALEKIRAAGHQVVEKHGMTPEELLQTVPDYEAMVVRSATKVRSNVVEKAASGDMKLVVRGGVGLDNIDLEAAKQHGIEVRNTPAASSIAVAELAMAHMLSASRYLSLADRTMKQGQWNKKAYGKGKELYHSTLGLVGFGRIAREVARRALGFGMNVVFYDPYIEDAGELEAKKVDLETLCSRADYISLHIPHNDETHHIIGSQQIAAMKDGVVVVNCARGGTVDEEALLKGLEDGKVFAAGVDVYEEEPAKDNSLVEHDSTTATPHIGAGTKAAKGRVGDEVAREIIEFFS